LFSIINKCTYSFSDSKIKKEIGCSREELQHARKDNQALARYINAKRKNEEARKKMEEEAR
jgi:hypothetical protein